jgi:hypothetical protein
MGGRLSGQSFASSTTPTDVLDRIGALCLHELCDVGKQDVICKKFQVGECAGVDWDSYDLVGVCEQKRQHSDQPRAHICWVCGGLHPMVCCPSHEATAAFDSYADARGTSLCPGTHFAYQAHRAKLGFSMKGWTWHAQP